MKKYFVYRFLDKNDNVLYVGQTNNIRRRMEEHFNGEGHLPEKCYSSVDLIEYREFDSTADMHVGEIFLINKYKPKYNKLDKRKMALTLEIPLNNKWVTYAKFGNEEYSGDYGTRHLRGRFDNTRKAMKTWIEGLPQFKDIYGESEEYTDWQQFEDILEQFELDWRHHIDENNNDVFKLVDRQI